MKNNWPSPSASPSPSQSISASDSWSISTSLSPSHEIPPEYVALDRNMHNALDNMRKAGILSDEVIRRMVGVNYLIDDIIYE